MFGTGTGSGKLASIVIVLAVLVATLVVPASASAAGEAITEFSVPTLNSDPGGITAGPDGNVWFTEVGAKKIGRITTSGSVTEYPIPLGPLEGPLLGIAAGPDGNLWFTAYDGIIGKLTPGGAVTEYSTPTGYGDPSSIAAGPDGNLWFAETRTNQIGRITTTGSVTEYPVGPVFPTDNIDNIAAGPDGNLWFMETANKIGKITTSGIVTEYPVPISTILGVSFQNEIAAGPDGNLWFTEIVANRIGRITTSGIVTEFPIPTLESGPNGITAGPDGNLWFTELGANQIGRITTSGSVTEFPIPTASSGPWKITTGPDGNIWFTEPSANQIGRVDLAAVTDNFLPTTVASPSPQPNGAGWNNSEVDVSLVAVDLPGGPGVSSGVKSITYSESGAQTVASTTVGGSSWNLIVSAEGPTTISYFATDNAGNSGPPTSLTIKLDKKPPTGVTATPSRPPDSNGWYNHSLGVTWSGQDALSGIASCSRASYPGTIITTSGSLSGTCTDQAGNRSPAVTFVFSYDATPPTIDVAAPTNNTTYILNQPVTASYACGDVLSGVATCAGTVASGSKVDTASVGKRTFAVSAVDVAGNSAQRTVPYVVAYKTNQVADVSAAGRLVVAARLLDYNNANVSASTIPVTALGIVTQNGRKIMNLNSPFTFVPTGSAGLTGGIYYVYSLDVRSLPRGTYYLQYKAGNDPTTHQVQFTR